MKNEAIGELKTKVDVYCDICGKKHKKIISVKIYNKEEIQQVKLLLATKAKKIYTCGICRGIRNSLTK